MLDLFLVHLLNESLECRIAEMVEAEFYADRQVVFELSKKTALKRRDESSGVFYCPKIIAV